jgi:hypothetical protein
MGFGAIKWYIYITMRMWLVDPKTMCRNHLLGEHVELHMLAGCLEKKKSIKAYIDKGLVDLGLITKRHDELVSEMKIRGSITSHLCRTFLVVLLGAVLMLMRIN